MPGTPPLMTACALARLDMVQGVPDTDINEMDKYGSMPSDLVLKGMVMY